MMNENKIIETLKYISQFVENRHDEGLGDYLHIVIGRADINVIDETIHLLERKQKETEEYKAKLENERENCRKFYQEYIKPINDKYREKIKEKLKELEEQKEKLKYDGNRSFADYEQFCKNLKFFKEQIEELLEEK